MKKEKSTIALVALSLFFSFSTVKAQSYFGIRGGVNFATFNAEKADLSTITRFLTGAYYTYNFQNSNFAVQAEILYSQKGAKDEFMSNIYITRINYLEIPLLAKYSFNTAGDIVPHIYIGPYLGIKLEAGLEIKNDNTYDINDEISSTDFGFVFGAGVNIQRFDIGLRYSLGLTDITASDSEFQNRVLSIVAGFRF